MIKNMKEAICEFTLANLPKNAFQFCGFERLYPEEVRKLKERGIYEKFKKILFAHYSEKRPSDTIYKIYMEKEPTKREGLTAVKYLMEHNVRIKRWYDKGADSDINTYNIIEKELKENERYKVCLIDKFIALDIDCKNGKDGLANFYDFFGKELLPSYLQEIENGSYPFYAKSPSGYHLYFQHIKNSTYAKLCDGVEIKTYQVSAGYKEGRPYVVYGDIENIMPLPTIILKNITKEETIQPKLQPIYKKHNYEYREIKRSKPDWERIAQWTEQDNPKGFNGRNTRAFALACHAKTHDYAKEETLCCLKNDNTVNGLPLKELEGIVKSVYKGN